MLRGCVATLCLSLSLPRLAAAAVTETETEPYPGVRHILRVDDDVPFRAHILVVDLSSRELRLVATAESERGRKTSSWATLAGVQVAVNGDYFNALGFVPAGLAYGGGSVWSISSDDETEGFLRFDRAMDQNHAHIEPPASVVSGGDLPPETDGVVGGRPLLVQTGVAVTSFDCADAVAMPCDRAPRTAVGLSEDGRTLIVAVVDGWQPVSLGMTAAELASLLRAKGAHVALALDGGSSSTLYVASEGGVVSSPSDGVERTVANHIGIRHGTLPPGTMLGFVRERDVFDTMANIAGATVTLDDGQTTTTGADGRYSFSGLTPRYTCATATHPSYRTATSCRDVPSAGMVFNSIALFPHSDFIDAGPGVPDAAEPPDARPRPDANPLADGGDLGDGGDQPGPRGDCGCAAAPGTQSACPAALFLAMLLLLKRGRG